jgi:hypothetical protein
MLQQQGNHLKCHQESPCQLPGYTPSKIQLTDVNAINAYTKMLQSTLIYKEASSYCRVCVLSDHFIYIVVVSWHFLG